MTHPCPSSAGRLCWWCIAGTGVPQGAVLCPWVKPRANRLRGWEGKPPHQSDKEYPGVFDLRLCPPLLQSRGDPAEGGNSRGQEGWEAPEGDPQVWSRSCQRCSRVMATVETTAQGRGGSCGVCAARSLSCAGTEASRALPSLSVVADVQAGNKEITV